MFLVSDMIASNRKGETDRNRILTPQCEVVSWSEKGSIEDDQPRFRLTEEDEHAEYLIRCSAADLRGMAKVTYRYEHNDPDTSVAWSDWSGSGREQQGVEIAWGNSLIQTLWM